MNIKNKKDIGEEIRASLVRPCVALSLLQNKSRNLKDIAEFVKGAEEDMKLIVDLSWQINHKKRK